MPSTPLAINETAKFTVIERYEAQNLMPAARAVRVGGKRVAAHRRPEARVAGEGIVAVLGDPSSVSDIADACRADTKALLKASHGAVPPPPPTKLTQGHLDSMVQADNKRDHREHKDKGAQKNDNHASPRPNVNSARSNKMGSNKRT